MKVVVNQSNYLPWKGYFDLIHDADLFIFYDDVQFTKNDWRNRNRLKTSRGPAWLTIPVGQNIHRLISEVSLPVGNWAQRHWETITECYIDAPYFKNYAGLFRDMLLGRTWSSLSALNQSLTQMIARDILGIQTAFTDSRQYALRGKGQERLLMLLRAAGTRTYISGPAAKAYLDESHFASAGITVTWKDYSGYPEYRQSHPPFEHGVSIVDLIFNMGPSAPNYIWEWRAASRTS
jgi:WbqC-like protein